MYLPPVNVQARPPMAFFPIFPDSHGVYNSHLTFYGVSAVENLRLVYVLKISLKGSPYRLSLQRGKVTYSLDCNQVQTLSNCSLKVGELF